MSELKTLKDLDCECYQEGCQFVDVDELRQEAIKHIKDAEDNKEVNGDDWTSGRIFTFKHFFNIDEEDLK